MTRLGDGASACVNVELRKGKRWGLQATRSLFTGSRVVRLVEFRRQKDGIRLNRGYLLQITSDFSENSPTNYLAPNNFYGSESDGTQLNVNKGGSYIGMRFFMPPILAVGSAPDPAFETLKRLEHR
jgi:hypothetical protein